MSWGYRVIARVEKARGRRGEVVAVPADGLPALLRTGLSVCVVPPPLRGERWHEVVRADGDDAGQLVALSAVGDRAAAEGLVGRHLLARTADLPADLALRDARALLGREVRDEGAGPVGTISEVLRGPANDVWAVEGALGEVLVPVVPSVVSEVPGAGPILVRLPAGSLPGEGEP